MGAQNFCQAKKKQEMDFLRKWQHNSAKWPTLPVL